MRKAVLLFWAASAPAWAGWPDDVTLDGIDTWRGQAVTDSELVEADYHQVLQELGTAISNKPMHGGATLGLYGFEVGLSNTLAFIDTRSEDGQPSPWERVHQDADPRGGFDCDAYLMH